MTGAIGAAVGFERVEIGIVLSLITFITLRLLTPVVEHDDYVNGENKKNKTVGDESEK